MANPTELRNRAAWYREFAAGAENLAVSRSRLRRADDLEAQADRIDAELTSKPQKAATD
jgi:hypothetical protein